MYLPSDFARRTNDSIVPHFQSDLPEASLELLLSLLSSLSLSEKLARIADNPSLFHLLSAAIAHDSMLDAGASASRLRGIEFFLTDIASIGEESSLTFFQAAACLFSVLYVEYKHGTISCISFSFLLPTVNTPDVVYSRADTIRDQLSLRTSWFRDVVVLLSLMETGKDFGKLRIYCDLLVSQQAINDSYSRSSSFPFLHSSILIRKGINDFLSSGYRRSYSSLSHNIVHSLSSLDILTNHPQTSSSTVNDTASQVTKYCQASDFFVVVEGSGGNRMTVYNPLQEQFEVPDVHTSQVSLVTASSLPILPLHVFHSLYYACPSSHLPFMPIDRLCPNYQEIHCHSLFRGDDSLVESFRFRSRPLRNQKSFLHFI